MSEVKYKLKDCITEGFLLDCKFDATCWTDNMKVLFQETLFSKGIYWWFNNLPQVRYLSDPCHYYYTDEGHLSYGQYEETFCKCYYKLTEYSWEDIFEPVDSGVELEEDNFNTDVLSESLSPEGLVGLPEDTPTTEWTDKHYDNYYTLTKEDIEEGKIRIDAYFVNRMWKLNSVDDTGCAFHCLKTYTRMANGKNSMERELNALNGQLKRWAKLMNVKLK